MCDSFSFQGEEDQHEVSSNWIFPLKLSVPFKTVYPLKGKHLGLAYVINNVLHEFAGSQRDVDALRDVLTRVGFEVDAENVNCSARVWRQGVGGYGRVWEGTAGCGRVRQGMGGYGRVWEGTAGYGRVQQGVGRYGRVWEGTAGCGRVRQGMGGFRTGWAGWNGRGEML